MNLQGYCLVDTVTVRTKSPCLGHGQRQTEEEMPPSLKFTKLKLETKLSELWLAIIKPVIWFEENTLNFNNVV